MREHIKRRIIIKKRGPEKGSKAPWNIKCGSENPNWRGGISVEKRSGYIYHPAIKRYAHNLIAEKVLGRPLKKGEGIHHIDGDGGNNKHSNLIVCSQSYHAWIHSKTRQRSELGRYI